MMSTEEVEKLQQKSEYQIRVFALTLIGVALNSVLAIPAYQAIFFFLYSSTSVPPALTVYLVASIILTLIYCWAASIVTSPKRLINPLYVQIASAAVVTLFISVANAHIFASVNLLFSFLTAIVITFLIAIVFFFTFGILQLIIVRWLVGLTGTIDDLDRKTYLIGADFKTISGILLSDSFMDTWNLEKRKIGTELLEIYTSYSASWQIKLVLGKIAEEPNKSILATVAFEKRFYSIFNSSEVSDCRDDMVRRLEFIIGKDKIKPTNFNNTPSSVALTFSLNVTKTKTIVGRAELGEIPSFYRNILVLMSVITAVVCILFGFGIIPLDFFATAIIMIIIALVIELGPRLKEVMDAKKVNQ